MNVRIRPATEADVAGIRRVARAAWHATYDDLLGPTAVERQVAAWYDGSSVRNAIERPDVFYYVACATGEKSDVVGGAVEGENERVGTEGPEPDSEAGRVVGYTSAVSANGPTDPATARLRNIYVAPDRCRTGIGTALLEEVTTALRDRGFRRLLISVLAANHDGRAFYEAKGFSPVDRSPTELGGRRCEEVVYAGPLDDAPALS